MRRWTAAMAIAMVSFAVAANAGTASAADPAPQRFAVGSPGLLAAQDIARQTWGTDPCGGQVEIVWAVQAPLVNATSSWKNPSSAYDEPELDYDCRITLNTEMRFDWLKLCTTVVHEYGHLAGQRHGDDGTEVMSPVYRAPLPACAATPEPEVEAEAPPTCAVSPGESTPSGEVACAASSVADAAPRTTRSRSRARLRPTHQRRARRR
jgi:hypothetical protein